MLSSSVLKVGDTRTGIISLNTTIIHAPLGTSEGKEVSCSVVTQDTRHRSYYLSNKQGLGDPPEYHCRASTEFISSSDDLIVA